MSESMNTVYITNINIVLKSTPQKVSILMIFSIIIEPKYVVKLFETT